MDLEKTCGMVEGTMGLKNRLSWSWFLMLWFLVLQHYSVNLEPVGFEMPFYTLLNICLGHLFIAVFITKFNRYSLIFQIWIALALMDLLSVIIGHFYSDWDSFGWMATAAVILTLIIVRYGKSRYNDVVKAVDSWSNSNGFAGRV